MVVWESESSNDRLQEDLMKKVIFAASILAVMSHPAQAGCSSAFEAGVDWTGCYKERLMLRGREASKGVFKGSFLAGSSFSKTDLRMASFVEAELMRVSFRGSNLSQAVFEHAYGSRISFKGAILKKANLHKAELQRSNFSGADLTGASMLKGDFFRSRFINANLTDVTLKRANISRTDFTGAVIKNTNFSEAYMYKARFEGVDLRQAKGLQQRQIEKICADDKTQLPYGLIKPQNWKCE
jgi:uncharacterized protein YjbI with pentapeptide repeats